MGQVYLALFLLLGSASLNMFKYFSKNEASCTSNCHGEKRFEQSHFFLYVGMLIQILPGIKFAGLYSSFLLLIHLVYVKHLHG